MAVPPLYLSDIPDLDTTARRFWAHVDKESTPDGCWTWITSSTTNGYGRYRFMHGGAQRQIMAHRLSYALHNGDIPAGLDICHECDNRICVRPAHLFIGTQGDNLLDMYAKGRGVKRFGMANKQTSLTDGQVLTIRNRCINGETCASIGREYGIDPTTIRNICRGRTWSHLGGPIFPEGDRRSLPDRNPGPIKPEVIRAIRAQFDAGVRLTDIAKRLDIRYGTVLAIAHRYIYKSIS